MITNRPPGGIDPVDEGKNFVGRAWLRKQILDWSTLDEPCLLLVGEPGIGKSAFLDHFAGVVKLKSRLLAQHFCVGDNTESLKSWRFVDSVAKSLLRDKGYEQILETSPSRYKHWLEPRALVKNPLMALDRAVIEPCWQMATPRDTGFLIVDAVDESLMLRDELVPLVQLLASRQDRWPPWVRLVLSTRPFPAVLELFAGRRRLVMDPNDPRNREDLKEFLHRDGGVVPMNLDALLDASAGNFLVAELIAAASDRPAQGGPVHDQASAIYFEYCSNTLRRHLPQDPRDVELAQILLAVLRAAREPLGVDDLVASCKGWCDLKLMSSVKDVSGIPTAGKNLIIVADVNMVLHFRIFDLDGKVVLDTDEKRLAEQARQIEDLRKQLENLWPPHELTGSERVCVITNVTSIVGHTIEVWSKHDVCLMIRSLRPFLRSSQQRYSLYHRLFHDYLAGEKCLRELQTEAEFGHLLLGIPPLNVALSRHRKLSEYQLRHGVSHLHDAECYSDAVVLLAYLLRSMPAGDPDSEQGWLMAGRELAVVITSETVGLDKLQASDLLILTECFYEVEPLRRVLTVIRERWPEDWSKTVVELLDPKRCDTVTKLAMGSVVANDQSRSAARLPSDLDVRLNDEEVSAWALSFEVSDVPRDREAEQYFGWRNDLLAIETREKKIETDEKKAKSWWFPYILNEFALHILWSESELAQDPQFIADCALAGQTPPGATRKWSRRTSSRFCRSLTGPTPPPSVRPIRSADARAGLEFLGRLRDKLEADTALAQASGIIKTYRSLRNHPEQFREGPFCPEQFCEGPFGDMMKHPG